MSKQNHEFEIIANKKDGWYCVTAVLLSLYQYYFNEKNSYEGFEDIMRTMVGKDTWTFPGYLFFAKKGVEIKSIEKFDYSKYLIEKDEYIKREFNENIAKWLIEGSNMEEVEECIPEYLKLVKRETREAKIDDIDNMLNEGFVTLVMLNACKLDERDCFSSHAVLVVSKYPDGDYEVNDPGLPPRKRKIDRETLAKALADVGEVTGFKKKQP